MPPSFYLPFRPRTCLSPLLFLVLSLFSPLWIIACALSSHHGLILSIPRCLAHHYPSLHFAALLHFQLITSINASIRPCSHFSFIVLHFHHVILFPVQSYKPEESGASCPCCFGGSTSGSPDSLCAIGKISSKKKIIQHVSGNMMKYQYNIQMWPKSIE